MKRQHWLPLLAGGLAVLVGVSLASTWGKRAPVSPEADCTVNIPSIRGGSVFQYAASGHFKGLDGPARVRARQEGAPTLAFPPEARMTIRIGDAVEDRVTISGATTSAVAASFASPIDSDQASVFRVEHIASDGRIVGIHHPMSHAAGNLTYGIEVLSQNGTPPLLGFTLFSDQSFTRNSTIHTVFPNAVPSSENASRIWWISIDLRVVQSVEEDGVCTVRLEGGVRFPPPPGKVGGSNITNELLVQLRDQTPVPTSYTFRSNDFAMDLALVNATVGDAVYVNPYHAFAAQEVIPTTTLEMKPLVRGFLVADGVDLPTTFGEAWSVMEDDTESRSWLDAHPDARVSYVTYGKGRPGSAIIDGWDIQMYSARDDSGALFNVIHDYQTILPLLPPEERTYVSFNPVHNPEPAKLFERGPTLTSLDRITRQVHGAPLDAFRCNFMDGFCLFGERNRTQQGYQYDTSGPGTSVGFAGGIAVRIASGLLLSNAEIR